MVEKWMAWLAMIPFWGIAGYYFLGALIFDLSQTDLDPTALIFMPALVMMVAVPIHLLALFKGILYRKNPGFLTRHSLKVKGIWKWIGGVATILFVHDFVVGMTSRNWAAVIFNLLALSGTVFYVSWFNTFRKN